MPRAPHSFRVKPLRQGFQTAYPRVPTIISAGIVLALLVALIVAGAFLSAELIDPATFEEGADAETLVTSGTVVALSIGLGLLLTYLLRRFLGAGHQRKDPPLAV
jgi:hypothetical protein